MEQKRIVILEERSGLEIDLREHFLACLGEPLRTAAAAWEPLSARLAEKVRSAHAAVPTIDVPARDFVAFLANTLIHSNIERAFLELRAEELYLVCACGQGRRAAIALFEERYFGSIGPAAARAGLEGAAIDDLKQILRERLFVSEAGRPPRIVEYRGRGPLASWMSVVVARAVSNLATRGPRDVVVSEELLLALPFCTDHPELVHLKNHYRAEFATALAAAIAGLSVRQRNLLRHHLVDGLGRDEIGTIYGVHGATANRWLVKARSDLERAIRQLLKQQLGVGSMELDSIVKLICSQLDFVAATLL